jgi:hypothetical protein
MTYSEQMEKLRAIWLEMMKACARAIGLDRLYEALGKWMERR